MSLGRKIRHLFLPHNRDREEDEAMARMEEEVRVMAIMERELKNARVASQEDMPVETQIMQESLECIKTTTGRSAPKRNRWFITEYDLEFCGTISRGGFAIVSKARFRYTMVAVKSFRETAEDLRETLEHEVEIWSRLHHDHIVPFYGASILTSPPFIVSRYMQNGNLIQYLAATPNADRTKLIFEVSLGMYYLHEEDVVHGDLKGANVLIDDSGKACITDFGLSKICSSRTRTKTGKIRGTLRFLAPEALRGEPLSFETDVYAFGMLIYEVFTEEVPFIRKPDHIVLEGRVELDRPTSTTVYQRGFNDELWQLLSDCISRQPSARPRFKTIQARIDSLKKAELPFPSVHLGRNPTWNDSVVSHITDLIPGTEEGNLTDWGIDIQPTVDPSTTPSYDTAPSLERNKSVSAEQPSMSFRRPTPYNTNFRHSMSMESLARSIRTDPMLGTEDEHLTTWAADTKHSANWGNGEVQQIISTLQSDLEVAREEAAYNSGPSHFQRDRTDLRSELEVLKRQISEANRKFTPGIEAFRRWMDKGPMDADKLSPGSLNDDHHMFAYQAFMAARSGNWTSVYQDARKSINAQPSTMGHIAGALAFVGKGEQEKAMQMFDLAFKNCNPSESCLLLLIKAVMLFVAGKCNNAISRVRDLISVPGDDGMLYCYVQVLGKMYMMQGDYAHAAESLKLAEGLTSPCTDSCLETISLIFGWAFDKLQIVVHCENLCASGRAEEAATAFLTILDTLGEEIPASGITSEWVTGFKKKCVDMLEALGDQSLGSGKHDEAIARYSSALSLQPTNVTEILMKRSKARVSKGSWEDALTDANEIIQLDPSSHIGYERKFVALQGAKDYDEAYSALHQMFSNVENSTDEEKRRLRENYTSPREAIAAIDVAIREIFNICPLVLINVPTGRLYNAQERVRIFKAEISFKSLVSETAMTKIDPARIRQSVAKYFKWIMFSHTWEGKEPTFQDVNFVNSVWDLDRSPLNEKLRQFCTIAHEDGYHWAWSDTCCIDKDTSAVLSQSLISMYCWYEAASETLVYLADVLSPTELGDLTKSRWMTRAWTLQELLASKAIRFYSSDWKLYLNDKHANHKESPAIKKELTRAMGVTPETITSFHPEDLGVRERLRLASTRDATVEEDIAYSLIGIFSSDIVPRYGLGKIALGHLLENIVARTGDVSVIAWIGASMPYNSALPNTLAVYSQVPYSPPPIGGNELDMQVEQLRSGLLLEDVLGFYKKVTQLPRATFLNRCLQLPCIVFSVTKIGIQDSRGDRGFLYNAIVSLLGRVEFRTADEITLTQPRKLVFVHPWLHDLRGQHDLELDDESELGSDAGSEVSEVAGDSDADSGDTDDASVLASPLHAEPSTQVDRYTQALRLIARLGCPFSALLLMRQSKGQYKRIASEHEIIIGGVPCQTNPRNLRAKVLEII